MKSLRAIAFALAVLIAAGAFASPARADVSFGFFYSNLSPYGSWAVSAEHGRVWRPSVAYAGWNPYYDGHWVYSDLGWTWVSDYEWGAVAYHYGTWDHDPVLGWVWIPGYVWAPSWVVFCTGPDYIGWAPVPAHYSVGVSVGFRDIGPDRFVIVPAGRFLSPRVRHVAVTGPGARVIINKTKIVNRITYKNQVVVNHGPDVTFVEKTGGRRVKAVPIERVRHAAPGPRVRREDLRAGAHRGRAAEPVPARTPLPDRGRGSAVEKAKSDRRDTPGRPAARGPASPGRREAPAEPRTRMERSPRGEPGGGKTTPPPSSSKKKGKASGKDRPSGKQKPADGGKGDA